MNKLIFGISFLLFIVSSYSAYSEQYDYYFKPDHVLSRSDNLQARPKWARETQSNFEYETKTYFVGSLTADVSEKTNELCQKAENLAKHDIANFVVQKVSYLTTQSSEDFKYKTQEITQLVLPEMKKEGCYWEKVAVQADLKKHEMIYNVFAKVSVPTDSLNKAINSVKEKIQKDAEKEEKARLEGIKQAEFEKQKQIQKVEQKKAEEQERLHKIEQQKIDAENLKKQEIVLKEQAVFEENNGILDGKEPVIEKEFIALLQKHRDNYLSAINEVQEETARNKRKKELMAFNAKYKRMVNWLGTIRLLKTSKEDVRLDIELSDGTVLTTTAPMFKAKSQHIKKDSQAYQKLTDMNVAVGDEIYFSGRFLRDGETDFFVEKHFSFSKRKSITNPEFVFMFDNFRLK